MSKKEFAIKLACLIILIVLNLTIYFNGKDLSCEKCIVNFRSSKNVDPTGITKVDVNLSITELYDDLKENKCKVVWMESQGFIEKKDVN